MIWPVRVVMPLVALAIPVQVWLDSGALFGVVAAFTFPPMLLLGLFASEWLLKPRPPGPRALAPLGALPLVPMVFVCAGWLLDLEPVPALLAAIAAYLPLAVLAVIRHPGEAGGRSPRARGY